MSRPNNSVPIWSSDDTYQAPNPDVGENTKLAPSAGEISQGHSYNGRPPAPKINWLENIYSRFIEHNDERITRLPFYNLRSINALANGSIATNLSVLWSLLPLPDQPAQWEVYAQAVAGEGLGRSLSPNGYDWQAVNASGGGAFIFDSASSEAAIIIATGTNSPGLKRSTDGTNFSDPTVSNGDFRTVFYTGSTFIASAAATVVLRISVDNGLTFSAPTGPPTNWGTAGYHAAQFAINPDTGRVIAVPNSGSRFIYTDDEGDNWSEAVVPNESWRGIAYKDGLWCAVNTDATDPVYTSEDDGVTWSQVTTSGLDANSFNRKIFVHEGYFVASRGTNGRIRYSEDGVDWTTAVLLQPASGAEFRDWHYGGGGFCAAFRDASGTLDLVTTLQADAQ